MCASTDASFGCLVMGRRPSLSPSHQRMSGWRVHVVSPNPAFVTRAISRGAARKAILSSGIWTYAKRHRNSRIRHSGELSRDENLTMRYVTAALFSLLSGCAAIQALEAADSEEILAEAGFHRQSLDHPGLPSRQLVAQAGMYKFADPDFCVCMYIGGDKEYAELQRLRAERIAERDWALRHNSSG